MAALLQVQQVSKSYPDGAGGALTVLSGVDFELEAGDSMAVVGPSGSGKSTLLNLIGGLDTPTSGEVVLDGVLLSSLGEAELARVRRDQVGFIFQFHHLLPQCSAVENVLMPRLARGRVSEHDTDRAKALLHRAGLAERMNHRPGRLSGGEQQRVAVVRALINQPKLLLADEPTGSLDRETSDELTSMLLELARQEGTALVVVTHSSDLARQMNRVYEMRGGLLASTEPAR